MADNDVNKVLASSAGNSDVLTRKYFESLAIEMRLVDSEVADCRFDFFGNELPYPIMMGVIGGFHHLGENAMENACAAAGELNTVYWVSSHVSDEDQAKLVATGTKIAIVIKPFRDQQKFLEKIRRARELGVVAIASDIDHAYGKTGDYDQQRDDQMGPKSVAELKEAVEAAYPLPFIAKGVLSVHDALKCREAGVSGIILSHHHNIMASAVPPVMILPEVRKAVGDDYMVMVDCGINGGAEAFKAIASGADAVLTARGYMTQLAKGGKEGVVEYIRKMAGEFRSFMSRTGSRDLHSIDPTVIHKLPF
ncbi:MAG: alpha-hydroxy-acid oxidizing enzyme [Erysipelotrichaceae bacterium]|nr:alpha-hydroxy-acid oxidizing enzyme [Erysipelotrichaceae bacterium]